jgi:hypothetical protein
MTFQRAIAGLLQFKATLADIKSDDCAAVGAKGMFRSGRGRSLAAPPGWRR